MPAASAKRGAPPASPSETPPLRGTSPGSSQELGRVGNIAATDQLPAKFRPARDGSIGALIEIAAIDLPGLRQRQQLRQTCLFQCGR
jgi:hypothetical protein